MPFFAVGRVYHVDFERIANLHQNGSDICPPLGMRRLYKKLETSFDKLTEIAFIIFGNSLTCIFAVIVVLIYLASERFYKQSFHDIIRDFILSITFLSFFLVQKWFNKFSTVLHLKMNELVAAHDKASNRMVNIENKTEAELRELAKHYSDLAEMAAEAGNLRDSHSIEIIIENQKDEENKGTGVSAIKIKDKEPAGNNGTTTVKIRND